MDFITVLIFLVVMAAVVYQRLMENAKKDAGRKRQQKTTLPKETEVPVEEQETPEDIPYIYGKEESERVPVRKIEKDAERHRKKTEEKKDTHPLSVLRNASEARRAFIYSEVFRRKYE